MCGDRILKAVSVTALRGDENTKCFTFEGSIATVGLTEHSVL